MHQSSFRPALLLAALLNGTAAQADEAAVMPYAGLRYRLEVADPSDVLLNPAFVWKPMAQLEAVAGGRPSILTTSAGSVQLASGRTTKRSMQRG